MWNHHAKPTRHDRADRAEASGRSAICGDVGAMGGADNESAPPGCVQDPSPCRAAHAVITAFTANFASEPNACNRAVSRSSVEALATARQIGLNVNPIFYLAHHM